MDVSYAERLKKLGLSWGDNGGFFKVMGGGTVQAQGSMAVPVEVRGWDACVPQRLRLDLSCDIMSAPAKIVLGYLTCKDLGLLMVAVQDFAVAWHTQGLWYQQMGRWNA